MRQGGALDRNAQRDEGVVDRAAAESVSGFLIRTGDLEVLEVWNGRKGTDERGDVGGGVKERRVLLHEEVGHFPAAIGRCADSERAALRLYVRFVREGDFFSGYTVEQRR